LVVGALLLLRFILKLAGANTTAAFVAWLYTVTGGLMSPFHGIFPTPSLGGLSVIDLPAITALTIYVGSGYGLTVFTASLEKNLRISMLDLKKHLESNDKDQTPTIPPR